jgi:hypothetical protein
MVMRWRCLQPDAVVMKGVCCLRRATSRCGVVCKAALFTHSVLRLLWEGCLLRCAATCALGVCRAAMHCPR